MASADSTPERLFIDSMRRPFETVPPKSIFDETATSARAILAPGSEEALRQFPRLRSEMLGQIFEAYPLYEKNLRGLVKTLMQQGATPVNAIYLSIMAIFHESQKLVKERHPGFQATCMEYEMLHGDKPFSTPHGTAIDDMFYLSNHGVAMMIGLLEAVPEVYRAKHGDLPKREKLNELVPGSVTHLFSGMTRVSGGFAVAMEQGIGLTPKGFNFNGKEYQRFIMDHTHLALRDAGDAEVLDLTDVACMNALQHAQQISVDYHECLATITMMESGGRQMPVFRYLMQMVVSLMQEHWFNKVSKA